MNVDHRALRICTKCLFAMALLALVKVAPPTDEPVSMDAVMAPPPAKIVPTSPGASP